MFAGYQVVCDGFFWGGGGCGGRERGGEGQGEGGVAGEWGKVG